VCGCAGVRVCGCAGVRVCGCAGVRVCGCALQEADRRGVRDRSPQLIGAEFAERTARARREPSCQAAPREPSIGMIAIPRLATLARGDDDRHSERSAEAPELRNRASLGRDASSAAPARPSTTPTTQPLLSAASRSRCYDLHASPRARRATSECLRVVQFRTRAPAHPRATIYLNPTLLRSSHSAHSPSTTTT